MKKILLTLLALGTLATFAQAEEAKPKKMMKMFQMVPADQATILQEGKAKMFCPECGMTLPMFYKTNHAATVDGKVKQYCSIYCIVEDTKKGSFLLHFSPCPASAIFSICLITTFIAFLI